MEEKRQNFKRRLCSRINRKKIKIFEPAIPSFIPNLCCRETMLHARKEEPSVSPGTVGLPWVSTFLAHLGLAEPLCDLQRWLLACWQGSAGAGIAPCSPLSFGRAAVCRHHVGCSFSHTPHFPTSPSRALCSAKNTPKERASEQQRESPATAEQSNPSPSASPREDAG